MTKTLALACNNTAKQQIENTELNRDEGSD